MRFINKQLQTDKTTLEIFEFIGRSGEQFRVLNSCQKKSSHLFGGCELW